MSTALRLGARRHQATLLSRDADLDRVARVIGIELDRPEAQRGTR